MKCNNCNFDNRDGVNFCERCGEPLSRDVNFNQHNKSDNENLNYDSGINLLLIIKILVGLTAVALIIFFVKDLIGGKDKIVDDNQISVYSSSIENDTTEVEDTSNDSDEDLINVKTNDNNTDTNKDSNSESAEEYIISYSSDRILTSSDVSGLSKKEIKYARNEIYARNGRKFNSKTIQSYFDSKSWYSGTIDPDDFNDETMLSDIEYKNVIFLKNIEDSM